MFGIFGIWHSAWLRLHSQTCFFVFCFCHFFSFSFAFFKAGWWSHRASDRFDMEHTLKYSRGAFGWQLSNPSVLTLTALRASLDLFDKTTMAALRKKSVVLTRYLERLLKDKLPGLVKVGECRWLHWHWHWHWHWQHSPIRQFTNSPTTLQKTSCQMPKCQTNAKCPPGNLASRLEPAWVPAVADVLPRHGGCPREYCQGGCIL